MISGKFGFSFSLIFYLFLGTMHDDNNYTCQTTPHHTITSARQYETTTTTNDTTPPPLTCKCKVKGGFLEGFFFIHSRQLHPPPPILGMRDK